MRDIKEIKSLEGLILDQTQVGDVGVKELLELPNLQRLNLSGLRLTALSYEHLKAMKTLRIIVLGSESKISDAAFRELHAALPECKIYK